MACHHRARLDPEMLVPVRQQAGKVLEHADIPSAQDALADRLQAPALLAEEDLLLIEVWAADPPPCLILEEDAELRDTERHLAMNQELQREPAASGDLIDLL